MTVPANFSTIPEALPAQEAGSLLETPLTVFLSDRKTSAAIKHAVKTVADILRAKQLGDLCTDEAEKLFVNRFTSGMAAAIRAHLWEWLRALDSDDAQNDAGDDSESRGIESLPPLSLDDRGRPIPAKRDDFPEIGMPPSEGQALDAWCARHKVSERLMDLMQLQGMAAAYGIDPETLPKTVRDAMLVTVANCQAPKYMRAAVVARSVPLARTYLHHTALALALAERRQAERAARAREPSDPTLARFLGLARQQRELLAAANKPRPLGTFLSHPITLRPEKPSLAYAEWSPSDQHAPSFHGSPFLDVMIAAWDGGVLKLLCSRCMGRPCIHGVAALDEVIATLCDPEDPVNASLAPILRVPCWSRLLNHLVARLAKAPLAGPGSRPARPGAGLPNHFGQARQRRHRSDGIAPRSAGKPAPLSDRWFPLAGAFGDLGAGRVFGRRHGPRQDAAGPGVAVATKSAGPRAGHRAHLGGRQLGRRVRQVRPRAEAARLPRRRAGQPARRPGPGQSAYHQLRHRRARRRGAGRDPVLDPDHRRGPVGEKRADPEVPRHPRSADRFSRGPDRDAHRESPG